MKHARPDYDAIQDNTAAIELANHVLSMTFINAPGQHAKMLAMKVLGIEDPFRRPDDVAITTNGTTRLIPRDEPVFLLRGQDTNAADTVRYWAAIAESTGAKADIVQIAREHAAKMDAWPKKKTPDLPAD